MSQRAEAYADSAYFSNLNGTFRLTLQYADSVRHFMNQVYHALRPNGIDTLLQMSAVSAEPPEIRWYHDRLPLNYGVLLDIRNESAVAALALHEWPLYRYNNKVYTQLFKETSADENLGEYCRIMQRSEINKQVAVSILVILLLLLLPAYYLLYYRHRLYYRFCVERVKRMNNILLSDTSSVSAEKLTNIELAEDECRRAELEDEKLHISNSVLDNCLSTLKHETMYYPSRIRQLIDGRDEQLLAISELANYYKELYSLLSEQAMRQVEAVKLKVERLAVTDILPANSQVSGERLMVLGDREKVLYGPGYIEDVLCKKRFRLSSRSFYQVNSLQTEKLYNIALDYAGFSGKERILDAYCGIGTIGIIASDRCKEVLSVELNAEAVKDAKINAKLNNAGNVEVYKNDAGRFMRDMAAKKEKLDVLFLDPPRSGASEEFLSAALELGPAKIVYVSCEPTTLARDLAILTEGGYEMKKAVPVDMFPYTEGVETVALLSKDR